MDQINLNSIQTLKSCIFHPNNKIAFVQVNDLSSQPNDSIFQCVDCFEQDLKFRGANHMLIQKIIQQKDSDFLPKWPPLNDQELIQKIHLKVKTLNSSEAILNQINTYFTQLKDEVIKKIDFAQKKAINQAEQMPIGKEQILKKYHEISQIQKLRELLLQDQITSFDLYQQSCKEFICQVQLQKDKNTKLFQDLLDQCEKTKDLINFDRLNQSKQTILEFLDGLSIFDDKIEGQVSSNAQQNQINQLLQNNNKVEKLMQLISNKSNYCGEEFLNQIRQQLQKLSMFFDKITFEKVHLENKKAIRFSELSYEKIDRANEYVEHQIKIQTDPEYLQSVKSSHQITKLQNIFANKFNFISDNYRDSFIEYLIETQSFQNQLNHGQMHSDEQSFMILKSLDSNYVKELVQLVQQYQKFSEQQQNFSNSQSYQVKQLIVDKILYNQNEVENKLKSFPIFDLLKLPKEQNILKDIQLFKGNYGEGDQRLQITKNVNNQFEVCINDNNYQGQLKNCSTNCVSQILERNKKSENAKIFMVGLMQNKNKDTSFGFNDKMSARFYLENNKIKYRAGNGIDKFIKGNSEIQLEENSTFELRVCLSEKILEVLDYPNHSIKLELQEELKNNLLQDDLCLYLNILYDKQNCILKEALIVDSY